MYVFFFFFKQKTAYEMRISDWSSDVCSSDLLTTGLHPGDLVILAGRPAMGKTSFALNIAEHTAMYEKKPALVFSMEMPAEQLALRMLSSFARIPMGNLRSGNLDDRDMDRLVSQSGFLREAPLYIDETGAMRSEEHTSELQSLMRISY